MWTYSLKGFNAKDIALNGNRFMLGNGYIGYRGTMEEFTAEQQVGLMINGLYDRVGDKWREPVNAPNGLFTQLECDGRKLTLPQADIIEHEQSLDLKNGIHRRKTVFRSGDKRVTVHAERFVSHNDIHLICMKYTVSCSEKASFKLYTGIDGAVWDINGPHLKDIAFDANEQFIKARAVSSEQEHEIIGFESVKLENTNAETSINKSIREIAFNAEAGIEYVLYKYYSIYTSLDCPEPETAAKACCNTALQTGYNELKQQNNAAFGSMWEHCNTGIEGDNEADFALRYSTYQLLILATGHSVKVSIPARGLSGQVYKGAVFWDTEMFMVPVFTLTMPEVARNLLLYRYHTLEGAKRKASEYGFKGAFYAWESQETGDDACSEFNVTDVFTGRPMRTYFRDKQIHVSADIVMAIWNYYNQTGDISIFANGAAEIMVECARFFYSVAYFKPDKDRYEILDVVGPDEYHERVNNNAFTNKMVGITMRYTDSVLDLLSRKMPEFYHELDSRTGFTEELANWRKMADKLYIPSPSPENGVIEQFDGYASLEDVSLEELKQRKLEPTEYLGGGNGLASSTKILKQADVVLMLNLFKKDYSKEIIRANWEYYEPRTEHGSSLSACAYSMTAACIGKLDSAYEMFMKTATIDITGKSKQFIGPQYIGGTHPAANGGAWMSFVLGFAGLQISGNEVQLNPALPEKWDSIYFNIYLNGNLYRIEISRNATGIKLLSGDSPAAVFMVNDEKLEVTK